MRSRYWSCSRFADWLRGSPKPSAATAGDWRRWREQVQEQHPVRFWLVEEALDYIQDTINWPLDKLRDIRYYVNNRWITRAHALTAHPSQIKPGEWQDLGYRFLPCLFNELVDFVEVEQAWHHCVWSKEAQAKYQPPRWRRWFSMRGWRCPAAGLEYLDWAASLTMDEDWGLDPTEEDYGKPTHQARAAREIRDLYLWYKEVYLQRPDPYTASGWTQICAEHREQGFDLLDEDTLTPEQHEQQSRSLELLREIEEKYEQEDEAMLIRLIRIRRALWT
jgi:hypothetical protein